MAVTKVRGSRRTPQLPPEAPASETPQPTTKHVDIFEAAASLSRGLNQVLADIDRLKQLGFFPTELSARSVETCRLTIEELRAWVNFEVTADVSRAAEKDWTATRTCSMTGCNRNFRGLQLSEPPKRKARAGRSRSVCYESGSLYAPARFQRRLRASLGSGAKTTTALRPHAQRAEGDLLPLGASSLRDPLDHLTELANGFEDTAQRRIRKQRALWETQEAERLRKKSEAEKAQWAWCNAPHSFP